MRGQHCTTAVSSPGRLLSAWDPWLGYSPHQVLDPSCLLLLKGTGPAQANTGLHSFTKSTPAALLLLIEVQIPTSKRAKKSQHLHCFHMPHPSHSIPVVSLKAQSALNRNGPSSEHPLQLVSAAVGNFLNLTVLEKAGGDGQATGVSILWLSNREKLWLTFQAKI